MVRPLIGLTGMRHVRATNLPGMPLPGVALSDDYTEGVERAGGLPVVIPFLSDDTLAQIATRLDGLLLSGGEDVDPTTFGEEPMYGLGNVVAERDRLEIALIHLMRAQGKPVLGICRGIQMLNVALGGTLYQDLPRQWKGKIQHAQKAARNHVSHRVKIEPGSRLAACFDGEKTLKVNSFHHQAIRKLAEPLRAVAWDAENLVEAVEATSGPFMLGVQWHPENLWRTDTKTLGLFRALVEAVQGK
ncbi:gamma-glutamyl-gamma-aminobutyrate hydrolase family protein [Alicyclobacillus fodiniaquatilis]|uniref:Gamma-glutamyl-gamma-aminobutyrate hydrolase family protein n=1 Tax=Alicyclobacillus fodiniaquatilis TaxID=1661150 RepID=A0ABW4JHE9_9BACL